MYLFWLGFLFKRSAPLLIVRETAVVVLRLSVSDFLCCTSIPSQNGRLGKRK